MSASAIASLANVSKRFSSPLTVFALEDVSLELHAGLLTVIMGPSGSGKSTLLNVLGLLDSPTSGSYTLAGNDVPFESPQELARLRRQNLGFVFQSFHLLPTKNVIDNVAFGATYLDLTKRQRYSAAYDLLEEFGLDDRATAMPATLSGGERQRVALARALVGDRRILLCDEPTGNLDEDTTELVVDHLRQVALTGRAVVVVTHDELVARAADTRLLLHRGRLEEV